MCLSIGVSDSHRCIERATDCDCPICGEYLFTSSTSVAALPCGHYMHRTCYDQYMLRAYRCPLCSKSAVNMELMWRGLDLQTERQTMPAAFADTRAIVFCNDCCAKSSTQYHWVGHKCALCGSYNTNDLHIVGYPGSAEPDSPARALSPTNGPDRPPVSGSPGAGSYFRSADDPRPTSSASADEAIVFSPYDMLHRMSRSLSHIRTYLLGPNVPPHLARLALFGSDGDDDGAELGGAGVDFWGQNRSSDSSSSDDDDNDDDDDDDDADDGDDEDDGLDDADDEANGIELLGHM